MRALLLLFEYSLFKSLICVIRSVIGSVPFGFFDKLIHVIHDVLGDISSCLVMDHLVDEVRVFLSLFLKSFKVLFDELIDHRCPLIICQLLGIPDLPIVHSLLGFLCGNLQNCDLFQISGDWVLTFFLLLLAAAATAVIGAIKFDGVSNHGQQSGS